MDDYLMKNYVKRFKKYTILNILMIFLIILFYYQREQWETISSIVLYPLLITHITLLTINTMDLLTPNINLNIYKKIYDKYCLIPYFIEHNTKIPSAIEAIKNKEEQFFYTEDKHLVKAIITIIDREIALTEIEQVREPINIYAEKKPNNFTITNIIK